MKAVTKTITEYVTEYDKKCEHGKIIDTQQCLKCYPDLSWATSPVTQVEWQERLKRAKSEDWHDGRPSPYPMQYMYGRSITVMILEEYGRLKGWL